MPYTPFILLTMARTGSTLLSRMLHQHSQIVSCDELFGENPRFSRQEYLRNLLLSASCGKVRPEHEELTDTHDLAAVSAPQLLERFLWHDAYLPCVRAAGFKLLYSQLDKTAHPELAVYLKNRISSSRVVLLVRHNWLRQFVSFERARRTGQWERRIGQPSASTPPIRTSPHRLRQIFSHYENAYLALEQFADGAADIYRISYEEFTQATVLQWRSLLEFLGADGSPLPFVDLQKQNEEPLAQCVADYESLRSAFADTPWRRFFDE